MYWILLSLICHVVVAAVVLSGGLGEPASFSEDVLDLTLATATSSQSQGTTPARSAPKKQESLPAQKISANSVSESSSANSGNTTAVPAGVENGSGGADSVETVGWSQVSRFPKVKKEVKATYPDEAKKARIDGPVNLEVVIDSKGVVRAVKLLDGPGYGLNESAMEALKQFEFQPAWRDNEPVAVKIRYTYRFKLGVN